MPALGHPGRHGMRGEVAKGALPQPGLSRFSFEPPRTLSGRNVMTVGRSGLAVAIVGALSVLAVAAAPASATLTVSRSRSAGASGNGAFTRGGLGVRCTTSTLSNTVAADGLSMSTEFDYNNAGRPTCTGSFGVSCEVTTSRRTPTTMTSRSTSSSAGVSAGFDVVLDANFTLEINCLGGGLVCTISGAQTIRSARTVLQGSPGSDIFNARGIRCGEGGTADYTASYVITGALTIS